MAEPGTEEWLAAIAEPALEPSMPIIDPHHHLWHGRLMGDYLLEQLRSDIGDHNVVKTVFIECRAHYREDGPEHLKSVGETAFVADIADQSDDGAGARIAAIVAKSDLRLEPALLDESLDAHVEASGGRFRGIRHALASARYPDSLLIAGNAPPDLAADPDFRRGVRRLGQRGFTYDSWHYHHQMQDFIELVRACPDTVCILDHFGTPLGVGPFANERDAIRTRWQADMRELARCENVVAKLGGLAMPDNGYGWDRQPTPPTSDAFVEAQRDWYLHTIDCFGPDRCMFESNFPVDRLSISYGVLYNGFKKIASGFSASDRAALFHDTAARVYGLRD